MTKVRFFIKRESPKSNINFMNQRLFSAVAPSGIIHLGNYLGAIKQWVELQNDYDCVFSIADYHAMTIFQPPQEFREKILEMAAIYLAAGIDPKKSIIFIQSNISAHAELTWILNTLVKVSELERMTQFKDKAKRFSQNINMGLFDYPVLMAADILLYKTKVVPVGEDQKQHLELCRTLAQRFNKVYGQTFIIPKTIIRKEGARIMGLDDPAKKMSKSAVNPYNYITLTDSSDLIKEKIKKAVTDSGKEIIFNLKEKPALSNLLTIYSLLSNKPIKEIVKNYQGKGYSQFKTDLAEVIINFLKPFQERFENFNKDQNYLKKVLNEGAQKAREIAEKTLEEVKEKIGLI
ncbi:MAG: tryptophanyl-tRNA synthetase [Parcubacteria group bacterium Athens1014_10]|nr:MAG: tryptophanyl-tRNA synthetase [Parcubacteria group bacterium Athens1014_10]TSD04689.1 MAG: tryptophanyl-tRNA synthetase [Parcubacteria group bacterium Athens0714_12]